MAITKIMQAWVRAHEARHRVAKLPRLFPRQIRDLFRMTESRAARKAVKGNYRLTEAQWVWLYQEWLTYIESLGIDDNRLSNRKLKILDKLTNSRLARVLLRGRGPAPESWWRAALRQWRAWHADTFGTRQLNPTMT
jgi:hypothetical protein